MEVIIPETDDISDDIRRDDLLQMQPMPVWVIVGPQKDHICRKLLPDESKNGNT